MTTRLAMLDVQKSFGATRALKSVSFELAPGETHALIGENGAGKSTLMKILSGACAPDHGRMVLDGHPYAPRSPLEARERGVAMIYQELNLAPDLSVEENILLGAEPARFGWLDRSRRRELARSALAELGHEDIPLDAPVKTRPIAQQQMVEIARALVGEPKVLIMDEPTSSLARLDTEKLFVVIERLRCRGVSVIYISHFLEECQRVCQRYTVVRDGESVASGLMAEARLDKIIRWMVGRDIQQIYPRIPHSIGEPVLEVRGLRGQPKPAGVSFQLRKGEIFGVAGLIGAGRTETLRACFGLNQVVEGEVLIRQKPGGRAHPSRRLSQGIGLLSENRKEEGLMLGRSLADNLTTTRHPRWFGLIRGRQQREATNAWMRRLDVRARHASQPISELSGGNQQKIAIGRLLHHGAEILLLDEPTRGVDVGSKAHIYRLMGELAAEGKAILFVSSYLPELLGVCDTIGVMCRGVLAQTRPAAEWTEHTIMTAAIGQETPLNA
jgi:ribose transport system ATP-binding protein